MTEPRTKRATGVHHSAVAWLVLFAGCSVADDPLGAGAGGSDAAGDGQAQGSTSAGSNATGSQQNGGRAGDSDEPGSGNAGTVASGTSGSGPNGSAGRPGGGDSGNGGAGTGLGDAGSSGGDPDAAGAGGASGGDAAGTSAAGSGAAGTGGADDSCTSHEDCVLCTTPISDAMPCCDGCPVVMSAKRCEEITADRETCARDRIAICPIPLCVFPGQPQCESNVCVMGDGLAQ